MNNAKNGNGAKAAPADARQEEGSRLPSLNEARINGRAVGEPRLHENSAWFKLAVSRSYKNKDGEWKLETAFVPVVAWGKQAQACKAICKGTPLHVEGRIRTYTDANKVDRWEIQARVLEPLAATPAANGASK